MILAAAVFSFTVDGFAGGRNLSFLLLDVVAIGVIALPLTLVVVTGEIDLSVASTLGLSSALMGKLWLSGFTIELSVVLCLVAGVVLGLVNGFFVTVLGLPSLAVTIGTLALYRGLATVLLGDQAVADFPAEWTRAATADLPGTPIPLVLLPLLVLVVLFAVLLHYTAFGRTLFAMGANAEAARFSGVSVRRTKLLLFVATGVISALAGIYWTLRYASARGDNGTGLELSVVAAVLLGGVSIFGGRGSMGGVVAAVLLLGTLSNGLRLADVSADTLTIVTGGLLIVSVVVPNLLQRARAARQRRDRAHALKP
ncbi:ABC transporter permease [Amycolatopsis sp. H20-H5]|nr:ABC transporter permease [Amycolatopsis sp. H20-H5]MEC3979689.1 ABC transporter permease [Amycolatopsis sp. H20-H5]